MKDKLEEKEHRGRNVAITTSELVSYLRKSGVTPKKEIMQEFEVSLSAIENAIRRARKKEVEITYNSEGIMLLEDAETEDIVHWIKHTFGIMQGEKNLIRLLAKPSLEHIFEIEDLRKMSQKEKVYFKEIFSSLVGVATKLHIENQINEQIKAIE